MSGRTLRKLAIVRPTTAEPYPSTTVSRSHPISVSPSSYRRITLVALVALVVIIVTGAAVRLTDSGLGCTSWPTCDETTVVPRWEYHQMIEGANRFFTGVVSAAIVLAVLGSLRRRPRRSDLTWLSLGLVAGVLGQIVLGGLTVLFHLWPPLVMGHFLLSLALVTCGLVLHERSGWPEGADDARPGWAVALPRRPPADPALIPLGRWLLVAGSVVVVTGTMVTGAGPHGGDPDADRLPIDILTVVRLHGIAMVVFLASTLVLLVRLGRAGEATARRAGTVLVVVLVAQAGIGYLQYFTGVPPLLVAAHVLGATIVWMALVHQWLQLRPPVPTGAEPATVTAVRPVPQFH
jgi:cytochrome c oxidase assembly protein subunit 15